MATQIKNTPAPSHINNDRWRAYEQYLHRNIDEPRPQRQLLDTPTTVGNVLVVLDHKKRMPPLSHRKGKQTSVRLDGLTAETSGVQRQMLYDDDPFAVGQPPVLINDIEGIELRPDDRATKTREVQKSGAEARHDWQQRKKQALDDIRKANTGGISFDLKQQAVRLAAQDMDKVQYNPGFSFGFQPKLRAELELDLSAYEPRITVVYKAIWVDQTDLTQQRITTKAHYYAGNIKDVKDAIVIRKIESINDFSPEAYPGFLEAYPGLTLESFTSKLSTRELYEVEIQANGYKTGGWGLNQFLPGDVYERWAPEFLALQGHYKTDHVVRVLASSFYHLQMFNSVVAAIDKQRRNPSTAQFTNKLIEVSALPPYVLRPEASFSNGDDMLYRTFWGAYSELEYAGTLRRPHKNIQARFIVFRGGAEVKHEMTAKGRITRYYVTEMLMLLDSATADLTIPQAGQDAGRHSDEDTTTHEFARLRENDSVKIQIKKLNNDNHDGLNWVGKVKPRPGFADPKDIPIFIHSPTEGFGEQKRHRIMDISPILDSVVFVKEQLDSIENAADLLKKTRPVLVNMYLRDRSRMLKRVIHCADVIEKTFRAERRAAERNASTTHLEQLYTHNRYDNLPVVDMLAKMPRKVKEELYQAMDGREDQLSILDYVRKLPAGLGIFHGPAGTGKTTAALTIFAARYKASKLPVEPSIDDGQSSCSDLIVFSDNETDVTTGMDTESTGSSGNSTEVYQDAHETNEPDVNSVSASIRKLQALFVAPLLNSADEIALASAPKFQGLFVTPLNQSADEIALAIDAKLKAVDPAAVTVRLFATATEKAIFYQAGKEHELAALVTTPSQRDRLRRLATNRQHFGNALDDEDFGNIVFDLRELVFAHSLLMYQRRVQTPPLISNDIRATREGIALSAGAQLIMQSGILAESPVSSDSGMIRLRGMFINWFVRGHEMDDRDCEEFGGLLRECMHLVLQNADVVVCTHAMAVDERITRTLKPTDILFDQASKIPDIFIPAIEAIFKDSRQFCLQTGDPLQMRPEQKSPPGYNVFGPQLQFNSFMRHIETNFPAGRFIEQNRCHPDISRPLALIFCDGEMQDSNRYDPGSEAQQTARAAILSSLKVQTGFVSLHIPGSEEQMIGPHHSRTNPLTAGAVWQFIFGTLDVANDAASGSFAPSDIAILSMHDAQVQAHEQIRQAITTGCRKHGGFIPTEYQRVLIGTVDKLQGCQKPIVVLDAVATSTPGWLNDAPRMFTALSRCRSLFFFVSNMEKLRDEWHPNRGPLQSVYSHSNRSTRNLRVTKASLMSLGIWPSLATPSERRPRTVVADDQDEKTVDYPGFS
ncbi:hypothetical protein AMS68_000865 [Peltaster fructicola]|uniref:DNA2/NAM7 helicase-like C-terminal domain-containing protein n=1 Tax=Peltaster fructicola TaxID=286661 RepID=A0A6H0XL37_9PEZI|nr:hypothetical protein AMS68_000865 [Peltaster fructicola]